MFLSRKFILFLSFLSVAAVSFTQHPDVIHSDLAHPDSNVSVEMLHLRRVVVPEKAEIAKEQEKADQRVLKKYVVTAAVAVSALAILMLAYEVQQAAEARKADGQKKEQEKVTQDKLIAWIKENNFVAVPKVPENWKPTKPNQIVSEQGAVSGLFSWAVSNVKSFGLNSATFVATSVQLLASALVVNGAWSYLQGKWTQVYQDETILWYAYQQTKIPQLLTDIKAYAVDYDLYGSLLSADAFNQEAQLHVKAFINDLIGSAQDFMNNELFKDQQYFSYLLGDMKKKYARKSGELEKLQDYVVSTAAKRNRAQAQEHAQMLFINDMNRRKDIAHMCDLLAQDMTKLTAFILMHGMRHQGRVDDMIASCNAYLAQMEQLLNATPEKLAELSKANQGMFTSVYEYERIFSEQINYVHRYCKLL